MADLPAGDMVGLAEARDDVGARRELGVGRDAGMRAAVVDHVLVDLVADQQHVGRAQQRGQAVEVLRAPDRRGRVVRRVDDQRARARPDRRGDAIEVGAEAARGQRHAHQPAAGKLDAGAVAVVARLEHDDLVARVHAGQDRGEDRLRRAGGDGDVVRRVVAVAVQGLDLGRQRLAQRGHAGHRRVLVVALAHRRADLLDQPRVAVEVRKALAEVDRAMLLGERRHDREDRRADLRQPAGQGWGAGGAQLGLTGRSARRRRPSRARSARAAAAPTAVRQRRRRSGAGRRRA